MDYVPLFRPSRVPAWRSKADFFKPFRSAAREAGENITPLYDPALVQQEQDEEPDLAELNASLAVLVELFPDVQPEVFREMLLSISKESRLQVVTEQLLKKKAQYVNGRLRPARRGDAAAVASAQTRKNNEDHLLAAAPRPRSDRATHSAAPARTVPLLCRPPRPRRATPPSRWVR